MAESKKILVADDEQQLALAVKIRLQSKGYTVVTANDGQQALQLAMQETPDLIILDVLTPVGTLPWHQRPAGEP
jgi:DNA-binding response OmpR family regulator